MKTFDVTFRVRSTVERYDTVVVQAESFDKARLTAWDELDKRANVSAHDEDWNIVQVRELKT